MELHHYAIERPWSHCRAKIVKKFKAFNILDKIQHLVEMLDQYDRETPLVCKLYLSGNILSLAVIKENEVNTGFGQPLLKFVNQLFCKSFQICHCNNNLCVCNFVFVNN